MSDYDPQGPAPALNRAWSRRGWAAPPHFGQLVPGLMTETRVTFERAPVGRTVIGGSGASGAPTVIWVVDAHVEEAETPALAPADTQQAAGVLVYHHYEVFAPLPADRSCLPRRGDWARFSDGITNHRLPVIHVGVAAGLLDHAEIWLDQQE